MTRHSYITAVCLAGLAVSGCEVGPDYKGPPAAAPIHAAATSFVRAGAASAGAPSDQWWAALGDEELNRLIAAALQESPDLAAARARLRQARAGFRQAQANRLPSTGATALYLRTKTPSGLLGGGQSSQSDQSGQSSSANSSGSNDLELSNAGFDATWEIDLFGANARAAEGARAQAEATAADLQDAQVSLTAEVAQSYIQLRNLQRRLALTQQNAANQERVVSIVEMRRQGGTASDLDLERFNGQLQSTRADLVPLSAEITAQLDKLAVLTGREPGALDDELKIVAAMPLPPQTVTVGDPAALLRRRPDIRAAERRLAQQTAVVGQRTADLFPKIQLLGDVGYVSTDVSRLFAPGNFTYVVAPVLQWTPFDFGRTRAKITAAEAARDEAEAKYRKTVLDALQDAEASLERYGRQREAVASLIAVQVSAEKTARLMTIRAGGGTATVIDQLDTERQRIQAETNVVQAEADLTQDFVALQKSLGIGWTPTPP